MRVLSMVITILINPSCKSTSATPVVQSSDTASFIQRSAQIDTVVVHDSVFVREYLKGDTVFRDRVQWRDRWRTRIVYDTIRDTQTIEKVIDHPPEKYIPPFYKHCTTILFIILAAGVVYVVVRLKNSF